MIKKPISKYLFTTCTYIVCYLTLAYTHYQTLGHDFFAAGIQPFMWVAFDVTVFLFFGYAISHAFAKGINKITWLLTIVFCFTWAICNITYSRIFGIYMPMSVMGEGGNLEFKELLSYFINAFKLSDIVYLILGALFLTCFCSERKKTKTPYFLGLSFIPAGLLLHCVSCTNLIGHPHLPTRKEIISFIPSQGMKMGQPLYVDFKYGVIRGELLYGIQNMLPYTLSKEEEKDITIFLQKHEKAFYQDTTSTTKKNIIFLLCESYLSITSDMILDGKHLTPTLDSLRHLDGTLYCENVTSNIEAGESSDGQLIYMTGLLPLKDDLTISYILKDSVPSIGSMLKSRGYTTAMTIPTIANFWHQSSLCPKYGIDSLYAADVQKGTSNVMQDDELISYATKNQKDLQEPFLHVILTYSTHNPYNTSNPLYTKCACSPKHFPKQYNEELCNYLLKCHFMDHQIGQYIKHMKEVGQWENSIIIIASDHKIKEYYFNLPAYLYGDNKLPFFICNTGKEWDESYMTKSINQVDIFPTILDVLKIDSKYRGLGKSLFEPTNSSSIDDTIESISSLIIRGNYFGRKR